MSIKEELSNHVKAFIEKQFGNKLIVTKHSIFKYEGLVSVKNNFTNIVLAVERVYRKKALVSKEDKKKKHITISLDSIRAILDNDELDAAILLIETGGTEGDTE